jgi:hypothetical protein
MILEWARLVAAEAVGGRGGATSGTALVWHRGGGSGQACGDLVVSLSGEARAVSCAAGSRAERGRLSAERLRRLYAWFDALRPFQAGDAGQGGAAARPVRLIFAGQGSREATPAERREIERFAAEVHGELTARAQPAGP